MKTKFTDIIEASFSRYELDEFPALTEKLASMIESLRMMIYDQWLEIDLIEILDKEDPVRLMEIVSMAVDVIIDLSEIKIWVQ